MISPITHILNSLVFVLLISTSANAMAKMDIPSALRTVARTNILSISVLPSLKTRITDTHKAPHSLHSKKKNGRALKRILRSEAGTVTATISNTDKRLKSIHIYLEHIESSNTPNPKRVFRRVADYYVKSDMSQIRFRAKIMFKRCSEKSQLRPKRIWILTNDTSGQTRFDSIEIKLEPISCE